MANRAERWAKVESLGLRYINLGASEAERETMSRIGGLDDVRALMSELEQGEAEIAVLDDIYDAADRRRRLHHAVVYRLKDLETDEADEALAGLVDREDDQLRHLAAARLADSTRSSVVRHLLPLLGQEDENLRCAAAWGLSGVGYRPAVPRIVAMLQSPGSLERMTAAQSLARLGDPSAEPALRRARKKEWRPWIRFYMPRRVAARDSDHQGS